MIPVVAIRVHAAAVGPLDVGAAPGSAGEAAVSAPTPAPAKAPAPAPAPAVDLMRAGIPPHRLRIVAIGCAFRSDEALRVRALGVVDADEARLLAELGRVLERFSPRVVTWDGGPHDLALLALRAFAHRVPLAVCPPSALPGRLGVERGGVRELVDLVDALGLRAGPPLRLDEVADACGLPVPGRLASGGPSPGTVDPRAAAEVEAATVLLLWQRLQTLRGQRGGLDDTERLRRFALAGPSEPLRRLGRALDAS